MDVQVRSVVNVRDNGQVYGATPRKYECMCAYNSDAKRMLTSRAPSVRAQEAVGVAAVTDRSTIGHTQVPRSIVTKTNKPHLGEYLRTCCAPTPKLEGASVWGCMRLRVRTRTGQ